MKPLACWLGQHEWLRASEPHRIFLRCDACGATTPGLRDDDVARPRVLYERPITRRFRVVKPKRRTRAA